MSFTPGRFVAAPMALAAGAAAALAQPPFGFLPGLIGYAVIMHLADEALGPRPVRSAFFRGWLAGLPYFAIGCWWVAEAFMVDARGQGWMAPFAVLLTTSGLSLFWGAAAALYRAIRPKGPLRALVFAGVFTVLEWLRGHLFTGFPWNLPGESWPAGSAVSQVAAVVGAYGLTWLTLLGCAVVVTALTAQDRRKGIAALAAVVLALLIAWEFGAQRLRHAVAADLRAPVVRIVQPDVKQEAKYDQASLNLIFSRYVRLTALPAARAPDIVIWSEGAIPESANELLAPGSATERAMFRALKPGATLLLGAYRVGGRDFLPVYYNSLIAVRSGLVGLRVTGVYDKYRLVPFGEYLPAESLLKPLGFKDLTHMGDSFTGGPLPAPMTPDGVPDLQPLICYEALFPDLVRAAVRRGERRPRWIVNVSNDAWFGVTSGPLQHLNMARYRAIEQGLPIARATPTGVTAMIDAYGRIAPGDRIGFGAMGVVDAPLPPALSATTYGRYGEIPLAIVLMLSLITFWRDVSSQSRKIVVTTLSYWRKHA
ncbi:MAG: apolipoprotein N-acyltransferase [Phenylobacterium sp.]